ncbi:MAG: glutamate-1-semialdehyde-2,1-aminomutase [Verrucomicrobia bacterium CG_4_10_14_3_um_filter_43_23]|nr:MAG: glutamate-1-semialdehyde-2,1-aminomutase [Verrucomicrobia bacterium CG1_02_43_26]PIP58703.1 MAG: glutamate-1-semialdehyde-2,1-aminomutase [Verrucomicrobia bacterium CG22_combo_CG10-13_8_21_14_all_43_17]PIX59024.1 MAG: glutamate-1-semialdehyde-2,1-aminomutase [Verrucomicrobia bacterium CG_4_10_14_3_um_filter_43_23]PIY61603.1 MAG: glutamate-1-semialdehyde-2,1-aminomutase [Verrucomicrobia bacterium CG_4_10_14_0_8_um_filter_43_34]PJA44512.1 MAG: glutamate-1-semialdehyde-2,1-aminomutase [Ver
MTTTIDANTAQTISLNLFERAQKVIPGGVNSPVRAFRSVGGAPFFTQSANGAILTTVDGINLIDFVCTWGPAIHGHNNRNIQEAIQTALNKGTSFGTPNPYEVEIAELITAAIPSVEKIRMVNSGTEATMSAIRLARGFTGRDKIIKFEGCYHGHADALLVKAGSGALTCGCPDSAGVPKSFTEHTIVLPLDNLEAVALAFKQYKNEIAAIILEPYPANCGLLLPREGYLRGLRELCTENGTVLIFDEVMSGFRVGFGGVQERENIVPDLTTFGKIIGGGLPVGAFGGKQEIMNYLAPLGPVYQAGTLSGNPLAMAAGIAALRLLQSENPYDRLDKAGKQLAQELLTVAQQKGIPLQIPQVGSMFALFFNETPARDYATAIASDKAMFNKVFHYALDNGVYLPPSAYETCFISTAHNPDVMNKAIDILSRAIKSL